MTRSYTPTRVLIIDEHGQVLGEFEREDALRLARERDLLLVELAPQARPPVCRLMDLGLRKSMRRRETVRRSTRAFKDVKLRPTTSDEDRTTKVSHARRFLAEGADVRVLVRFRGREMAFRDVGVQLCLEFAGRCGELGRMEGTPKMEGRQMVMILVPNPQRTTHGDGTE